MVHKRSISLAVFLIGLLACFNFAILTPVAGHADSFEWPNSTPEEQGMDSAKLADLLEHVKNFDIDSITIVRNDHLVMDARFYPFVPEAKHIINSCTKSVMSLLIGIAIDKGYIEDVQQPVIDFFPDKNFQNLDNDKKAMTLENLLTMTSGLQCRDSWKYRWRGLSALRSSDDWVQYMLDLPMAEPPGTRFEYCNGASFLLSAIIHHVTKMSTLEFARTHLFNPLGISDLKWSVSPRGIHTGFADLWMKPRDMAKIGRLLLHRGRWNGRQIVSESWVEQATSPHIAANLFAHYGYQVWVIPTGFFAAVGYGGQFIFIAPQKNLVAVFTSQLAGGQFYIPRDLILSHILPAAISETPLDPAPENNQRMDALLKTCAAGPPDGYVWKSKAEGAAKDGKFVRTARPAFHFSYPIGSKKMPADHPAQVLRMKTIRGIRFDAGVLDIPEGVQLAEIHPRFYAPSLFNFGSDVEVQSNRSITLKDGTPAYRSTIHWRARRVFPTTTIVTSVFKDGKWVYVATHPWTAPEEIAPILDSLQFD